MRPVGLAQLPEQHRDFRDERRKVGIGTASPLTTLDVYRSAGVNHILARQGSRTAYYGYDAGGNGYAWLTAGGMYLGTNDPVGGTLVYAGGAARMAVISNGNVGIGTTNPQYKLAVNGTIGAKEVIVTNTGWPDHVFRPGYRLRPLSEVAAYIRAHRHLPGIPSEAEVKEKGVSVGDMQAKLLAKIEELTLHMIQQDKENQELRQRIVQLETRVAGR